MEASDTTDLEAESQKILTDIRGAVEMMEGLMRTPVDQERAIELWEKVWTETAPDMAQKLRDFIDGIDTLPSGAVHPETLAEIIPTLQQFAGLMDAMGEEKAPNPDLIALYYLRRLDKRVEKIEKTIEEGRW